VKIQRSGGFEEDEKNEKKIRPASLSFILAGCVRVSKMVVNACAMIGWHACSHVVIVVHLEAAGWPHLEHFKYSPLEWPETGLIVDVFKQGLRITFVLVLI
jgi:hypothetical protein